MPKINQEEYEVLKGLDDKWKWIARDGNDQLFVYELEPYKSVRKWLWLDGSVFIQVVEHLFQFIQWEDEEPQNIAELIEEYEDSKEYKDSLVIEYFMDKAKESEETEVKDKKWLQDSITKVMQDLFSASNPNYFDFEKANKQMRELVNQLDDSEPKNITLQDITHRLWELPVIPRFVAEWIEEVKPDNSLRVAFEYIAQRKKDNYDDELAFWVEEGNSETFARAWLDGYTVEEEQKYYVLDKEGHLLIRGFSDGTVGRVGDRMKPDLYPDWNKKNLPLTEQEIKDYDPRYMTFAKPVEELEVLKEEK